MIRTFSNCELELTIKARWLIFKYQKEIINNHYYQWSAGEMWARLWDCLWEKMCPKIRDSCGAKVWDHLWDDLYRKMWYR